MITPYDDHVRDLLTQVGTDPKVSGFLAEASPDPEEHVLASIKCMHGQGSRGHLAITTHRIRYFQRFVFKSHDFWPLATTMVMEKPFPPIIVLGGRELFQGNLDPRPMKAFVSLHQQMVEAMHWEAEHTPDAPVPVVITGSLSLSEDIDRLHQQFLDDLITAEQYEAFKRKLLGA
jgi:hypothetical protein